jgi:hypothetical protein
MARRQAESVRLQVTYVGNHALDWFYTPDSVEPSQADTATSSAITTQQGSTIGLEADDEWSMDTQSDTQTSQSEPTTHEDLLKRFEGYILRLISESGTGSDGDYAGELGPTASVSNKRRNLIVSLALVREFSSTIPLSLDAMKRYDTVDDYLCRALALIRPESLILVWHKQRPEMEERPELDERLEMDEELVRHEPSVHALPLIATLRRENRRSDDGEVTARAPL